MRPTFAKTLVECAEKNQKIFALTCDVGYGVLEDFDAKFPGRYFNIGVAEPNMMGIAAGLAMAGKLPVTYSMSSFTTLRGYEQIRNDISSQNLNVKLVGVGCGLSYSLFGPTHQAIEDIALMRVLPNFTVLCPGDPVETELATRAMLEHQGPVYLRLAVKGDPVLHKEKPKFEIGKAIQMKDGNDLTLIGTSNMLVNTIKASELLESNGLKVRVLSMHSIKPLDKEAILNAVTQTKAVFTIEEHNIIGGLGSAVSEVIAESGLQTIFKRLGINDTFGDCIGSWACLRNIHGISPEAIQKTVLKAIGK